jgi:pantoate ligase / CMP/dCMP kinase
MGRKAIVKMALRCRESLLDMTSSPRILVLKTVAGLQCFLRKIQADQGANPLKIIGQDSQGSVGFVPTMGALHRGHMSLMQRARQENATVIVSIFVNPLQFGPREDFSKYPRTLEADFEQCQQARVDAIFVPEASELITSALMTQVMPPASLTDKMCGRSRPGHFQGVATIVLKLFNLVRPTRAYFGQKDAQQLAIIRKTMCNLNLAVEIVSCPTVRESSGLALSSRNRYLTPDQRKQAAILYQSLSAARPFFQQGVERERLLAAVRQTLAKEPEVQVEYLEFVNPETLESLPQVEHIGMIAIAAHVGTTRLIDNILLDVRRPILAIDGPAGAGKSTVTRRSAAQLGLLYLDTGAMYRAMTWLVLQSGLALEDEVAIADLVSQARIELLPGAQPTDPLTVRVNSEDVTDRIRSLEVTSQVSTLAAQSSVREILKKQQQAYAQQGGVAAEGRDMGTHVFPQAGLKIFLTATIEERARRRYQELQEAGNAKISYDQLVLGITERDRKDSQRAVAPLRKAEDAVEILTDGLSVDDVVEKIVSLYRERCAELACGV